MRGARGHGNESNEREWIIPADAGSTRRGPGRYRPARDHPRGCGEHNWAPVVQQNYGGSSPRMRGALSGDGAVFLGERIIPADAGSTLLSDSAIVDEWNHPRGCGEHSAMSPKAGALIGSSPRMRGAQPFLVFCQLI